MLIAFTNARVFDGVSEEMHDGSHVVIEDGLIREIAASRPSLRDATYIDCGNRVLMPGLIDAHFHAYLASFDIARLERMPPSLAASHAGRILEGTLERGFTTVRDAGGGDIGLRIAIEQGLIRGPRFYFAGKALSQTGGHGDTRRAEEVQPCGCGGHSGVFTQVVDGVEEVRKAAREELRKGADQIKIFVSGGVLSPTDPIWMPQFTAEEIAAAVYEASTRRTYVMAHCHTDEGAARCVENGVRTVEHGTLIHRDETARLIAARGGFVVPTLSVINVLQTHAAAAKIPAESVEKVKSVGDGAYRAIEVCRRNGVKLGLGTDLGGHEFHPLQGGELELRGRIEKPIDVLRSATSVNAQILQQAGRLGQIAPGAWADILVLDFDPLKDLGSFRSPERIPVVMKGGAFVRNRL